MRELKALKLDGVVDAAGASSISLTGSDAGDSDVGAPASPAAGTSDSASERGTPVATPSFVRENFKSKIMKKSIDDLLHDQNSVDQLIGGAANEFVEVDQETMQK